MEIGKPPSAEQPGKIRFISNSGELDFSSIGRNLSPEAREKMQAFLSRLNVDQLNAISTKWSKKITQHISEVPGFGQISDSLAQFQIKTDELSGKADPMEAPEAYQQSLKTGRPLMSINPSWKPEDGAKDSEGWRIFVFILALIAILLGLLGVPLGELFEEYFLI